MADFWRQRHCSVKAVRAALDALDIPLEDFLQHYNEALGPCPLHPKKVSEEMIAAVEAFQRDGNLPALRKRLGFKSNGGAQSAITRVIRFQAKQRQVLEAIDERNRARRVDRAH